MVILSQRQNNLKQQKPCESGIARSGIESVLGVVLNDTPMTYRSSEFLTCFLVVFAGCCRARKKTRAIYSNMWQTGMVLYSTVSYSLTMSYRYHMSSYIISCIRCICMYKWSWMCMGLFTKPQFNPCLLYLGWWNLESQGTRIPQFRTTGPLIQWTVNRWLKNQRFHIEIWVWKWLNMGYTVYSRAVWIGDMLIQTQYRQYQQLIFERPLCPPWGANTWQCLAAPIMSKA